MQNEILRDGDTSRKTSESSEEKREEKLGDAEFTLKGFEKFRRVGNHTQSTNTTAAATRGS